MHRIKLFRVFAGTSQLLWGIWLLIFPNIFSISPTYTYMAEKATQTTWGLGILAIATIYLHSLIISKAYLADTIISHKAYRWYHRIASYTSLTMWLIITGVIIVGNYRSTGSVIYSMISLFFMFELIREK